MAETQDEFMNAQDSAEKVPGSDPKAAIRLFIETVDGAEESKDSLRVGKLQP